MNTPPVEPTKPTTEIRDVVTLLEEILNGMIPGFEEKRDLGGAASVTLTDGGVTGVAKTADTNEAVFLVNREPGMACTTGLRALLEDAAQTTIDTLCGKTPCRCSDSRCWHCEQAFGASVCDDNKRKRDELDDQHHPAKKIKLRQK